MYTYCTLYWALCIFLFCIELLNDHCFLGPPIDLKCFGIKLISWFINGCAGPRWLQPMSTPMETVTRAITAGLHWASLFDGANQDHDYYLARAAGRHCLGTCFPKETTEGQLLSAELFSLLSMCVLAACLWPTDPPQQHEMGPPASLLFTPPTPPPPFTLYPIIYHNWSRV